MKPSPTPLRTFPSTSRIQHGQVLPECAGCNIVISFSHSLIISYFIFFHFISRLLFRQCQTIVRPFSRSGSALVIPNLQTGHALGHQSQHQTDACRSMQLARTAPGHPEVRLSLYSRFNVWSDAGKVKPTHAHAPPWRFLSRFPRSPSTKFVIYLDTICLSSHLSSLSRCFSVTTASATMSSPSFNDRTAWTMTLIFYRLHHRILELHIPLPGFIPPRPESGGYTLACSSSRCTSRLPI